MLNMPCTFLRPQSESCALEETKMKVGRLRRHKRALPSSPRIHTGKKKQPRERDETQSSMVPIQNFEQHARRFMEPDLPMQIRYQLATEVRDNLEIVHTAEYLNFLKRYFRLFSALLTQLTKPQATDSVEHRLRSVIMELLNRLPHSEVLRPFVEELLKVAIHVLATDNEENGLICVRMFFDLLRNYRPRVDPEVQPFLDFVEKVKESKRLVKCFLNYLRHDKTEVGVLFDMLSIFLVRTRIEYTFLKEFYMIEVAEGYNPQMKKAILVHFLHLFQSKELSQDHLVVSMQMLILPMLAHTFQNSQSWDVVDASIIKTIAEKLFDPPEEVSAEYDEPLILELLQLATLLLKYLPNDLVHHRKELIKFGWTHLKRENSTIRQWAFVSVCHFLEAYQAPERIILQVFVALLRTCQPENKVWVNQALDILMPALPRRLPVGDYETPIWIRYTKIILLEEEHSVPNLIHIFQLIVRHSDLFYSCRANFVPQIVNSLSRLGLPQNTLPDNRRLAIELAGLVVGWEKQRRAESSIGTPGSAAQPDEEYKPNATMEEMIINFLIQVALVTQPKDKEMSAMYKKALDLLSQALEIWPTANIYLEKLLSSLQPSALAQVFDVMNKVLEKQPYLFSRDFQIMFSR